MRAILVALTILLSSLTLSCGRMGASKRPKDEATPEQKKIIASTIQEIIRIAHELGHDYKFDSIPIIVTSEYPSKDYIGYCATSEGKSRFITIDKSLFEQDKKNPAESAVFSTLLHEFGHCYFNRNHTTKLIRREGYLLNVVVQQGAYEKRFFAWGFPTSVMFNDYDPDCRSNCKKHSSLVTRVSAFNRYWVAELIGLYRVRTYEDLRGFENIKWVQLQTAETREAPKP